MPQRVAQHLKDAIDQTAREMVEHGESYGPHRTVSLLIARAVTKMLENYPPIAVAVVEGFKARGYACTEAVFVPTWEIVDGKFRENGGYSVRARYWELGHGAPKALAARTMEELLGKIEALPHQDGVLP